MSEVNEFSIHSLFETLNREIPFYIEYERMAHVG